MFGFTLVRLILESSSKKSHSHLSHLKLEYSHPLLKFLYEWVTLSSILVFISHLIFEDVLDWMCLMHIGLLYAILRQSNESERRNNDIKYWEMIPKHFLDYMEWKIQHWIFFWISLLIHHFITDSLTHTLKSELLP